MIPTSFPPFAASVVILTGLPLDDEPRSEPVVSDETADASSSPLPRVARMLSAGCYSVSIFGSGAEYAG